MVLSLLRPSLIACVTVSLVTAAALAQPSDNYMSVEVTPEKPAQLSYHGSAHKTNCTPAAVPTVRVVEPPKKGTLTVRQAVLTADKIAGCPPIKTPARVVFYQARAGYEGPDHVKYEVTSEKGEVANYDVTITVKETPSDNKPAGTVGGRPL